MQRNVTLSFKKLLMLLWTLKSAAIVSVFIFLGKETRSPAYLHNGWGVYEKNTLNRQACVKEDVLLCFVVFCCLLLRFLIVKPQMWESKTTLKLSYDLTHTHINGMLKVILWTKMPTIPLSSPWQIIWVTWGWAAGAAPQDKVSVRWNGGSRYPTNSNTTQFSTPTCRTILGAIGQSNG